MVLQPPGWHQLFSDARRPPGRGIRNRPPAGPAPCPRPASAGSAAAPLSPDLRHPAPGPARASPGLRCRDLPGTLTNTASSPQQVQTPAADQLELPAFIQPTAGRAPGMRTAARRAGSAPDSDWSTVAARVPLHFLLLAPRFGSGCLLDLKGTIWFQSSDPS